MTDPLLALMAARILARSGELEKMESWLTIAECGTYDGPLPDGHASLESATTLLWAWYASSSVRTMREAVEQAVEAEDNARDRCTGLRPACCSATACTSPVN